MAINKKLIHFKKKEDFEKEVANENILDTSIVFIKDSKEIHTHEETYKTVTWTKLFTPSYEIVDKDPNNWMQGVEHEMSVKRLTEGFPGQLVLQLECTGGTIDNNEIIDDGSEDFEKDFTVLPNTDKVEISINCNDKKVKGEEFTQNEVEVKKEVSYTFLSKYIYEINQYTYKNEGFDGKCIYVNYENAAAESPDFRDTYKLKITVKGFKGELKIMLSAPKGYESMYEWEDGYHGGAFVIGKLDTVLSGSNDVQETVSEKDTTITYNIPDNGEHFIEVCAYSIEYALAHSFQEGYVVVLK